MQILSIHLKNIKSHRDREIHFSPGINVLSGPNGVGKSTVFEAIGYALFGVDARDFVSNVERFLSIGAKRGEISVTFSVRDEKYRVTRTVGTPSTWRLACGTGAGWEVEEHAGGDETEARIRELLGLAKGRPLAEQFKLVIGPFQSDFLGPFVLRQPTRRKEAFDEILGIDSWRKAFDGTKELASAVKSRISTVETEIAGKEERVACLPRRREELEATVLEEGTKRSELDATTAALSAATLLLSSLDERKGGIERLQAEITQCDQSIGSGQEHISTQRRLVEEAEAAAAAAAAAKPGKERYEATEKRLAGLREKEKVKQALEKEIAVLESRAASALQAAAHEEREVAGLGQAVEEGTKDVAAETGRLQELAARLDEEEKALRAEYDRVAAAEAAFRELPLNRIDTLLPYLRVTLDRLLETGRSIDGKKVLLSGEESVAEAASSLESLRGERDGLLAEKSLLLGQRGGLVEGEEKLGEGLCPFFSEKCGNLAGSSSLEIFAERKRRLDLRLEAVDAALAALDVRLAAAEAARGELERFRLLAAETGRLEQELRETETALASHLKRLDPEGVAGTLRQWGADHGIDCSGDGKDLLAIRLDVPAPRLPALIEEWETVCRRVAARLRGELEAALSEAREPLAAAGSRRGALDAAAAGVERRRQELQGLERRAAERRKEAAAHREAAAAVGVEKERKKDELASCANVEDDIRAAEAERLASQPDHRRFLQAEPVAADLPKRRDTLGRWEKRLAELSAERVSKVARIDVLREEYSPEGHAAELLRKEKLAAEAATLTERLKNLGENRKRLEKEIAELDMVVVEIRSRQKEVIDLRKKEETVRFLRNRVFRNVSAQLSERFREEIGLRADRIYRTISEADEELVWGDDYRVALRDMCDGTVRERCDDQLSGGQMMSAVVALRLALLQTTGARIAFFDEPTSNLDAARRENLAQAFRAIDHGEGDGHWYDQLFLISHDVAFTEITDQIINLGDAP